MTTTTPRPLVDAPQAGDPRLDADVTNVDIAHLSQVLLGHYPELRLAARNLMADERFHQVDGLSPAEHRERVLGQLRLLAVEGDVHRSFPTRFGGLEDHGGFLSRYEELTHADPSLQIKVGVQWGLFASAIYHLGTEGNHDEFLPDALSLAVPGAFAMTETGHGSDVAAIGTTATYDPATQEFVIHTPFRAAWKDYLGNAGLHGTAATVFARLITSPPGGRAVDHGVHAFYVPIRDAVTMEFLPGVGGEDDGLKGGLNGIDNGRLWFDQVRVPRTNLLNRYGDVAEDGTYSSPIPSPGRRFFTMLGTLVQGRVSLDGAAVSAARVGLTIAITYGNQRRQFSSASPTDEVVLLDYAEHQRRLLPLLAETYAAGFAHEDLLAAFDDVFSGRNDTPDSRADLETLAAALKPASTWHALNTLQVAREACGGAGYLTENRLTGLRADLDVFTTFEGDNTVLLQLVGKRLLTDYSKTFKGLDATKVARLVAERASDAARYRTPLHRAIQTIADVGDPRRSAGQLRETATQRELLVDRVETMVAEIAQALRPAQKADPATAAAIFNAHQHELIEAARAHAELVQWESFTAALERVTDPGTRQILTWVRDLFGLTVIERNLTWYLLNGRLSAGRARTVTSYIDRLLARLRPHAQSLVDAFGYEQAHLRAPIASGAEQVRQDEARAYYRAQRASGDAPVPEKYKR
ncbi:acyl-CoA dehydrogenase family protein [Cellulomonas fengjieae]|uniref:Acyl-CoA dehydrogenase family protein n=1 Tax=Cellulomonas fengjieae TaxID=2819978 RepID=A0ABS3SCR0_9CELL|nr:acyl-CoA dehydrogenase [Cellulomonas fengjieae]MBO3083294.1 acyl-CoA dehydrogenase family protein [Cellulomonas fengjieae]QVI65356.1 acyl-CoA dehydrogenase family protein [Cellulomonas fengjieae]